MPAVMQMALMAVGGGPKGMSYIGNAAMSVSGNTLVAAALACGSDYSRKYFMIAWSAGGTNRTLTGVTFGGEACTLDRAQNTGNTEAGIEFWYIDTAATSGDLVATFDGAPTAGRVGVYNGQNVTYTSGTGQNATDSSAATVSTGNITAPAGAWVIAAARFDGSSATCSWGFLTEVADWGNGAFTFDEDVDEIVSTSDVVTLSNSRTYRRTLHVVYT